MSIVPCFSARQIDKAADYERFHHCGAYLRNRSALFQGREDVLRLMEACGYQKEYKFIHHRKWWDHLAQDIPLAYLKGIGVRLEALADAAAADMAEFLAALNLPLRPRWATEHIMGGFSRDIKVAPDASEAAAVAMVIEHSRCSGRRCCLNFFPIKNIFVEPDGTTSTKLFTPALLIEKKFLHVEGNSS